MNERTGRTRLSTEALARVEGEGAMHVDIVDGRVSRVELSIYEPPRFYEAFLRGRSYTEPPDITARICGICPVAYQMSACAALEDACGVTVDDALIDLRRLLYCGEWIESHALHVHLLHAPDFLGVDSVVDLARLDRGAVERALELKKIGNDLVELVGGRPIHPVNVRVGGFHKVPTVAGLLAFRPRLERALELAVDATRWVSGFDFPDLDLDHELMAVVDGDHYPVLGERIVSNRGLDIAPAELSAHVIETQVAHSTAKHAHRRDGRPYLVGPLARFGLARDRLAPTAAALAAAAGLPAVCTNPFRSIVVRSVEIVHACEEALRLVDGAVAATRSAVPVTPRAGTGYGVTEAPRGLLYHHYRLDDDGLVAEAEIIPPTSQNQPSIERELFAFVEANLGLDDDQLKHWAEVTIRNHDPCISCATHFLDLTVTRTTT